MDYGVLVKATNSHSTCTYGWFRCCDGEGERKVIEGPHRFGFWRGPSPCREFSAPAFLSSLGLPKGGEKKRANNHRRFARRFSCCVSRARARVGTPGEETKRTVYLCSSNRWHQKKKRKKKQGSRSSSLLCSARTGLLFALFYYYQVALQPAVEGLRGTGGLWGWGGGAFLFSRDPRSEVGRGGGGCGGYNGSNGMRVLG